jgi:galactokinase
MDEPKSSPRESRVAFAPGRVNLIGDHTDYTGGLAMPMAIHLGTTVTFNPDLTALEVTLESAIEQRRARIPLSMPADPVDVALVLPAWARFVGAVVALVRPVAGGSGSVLSDLPVGAGLSSSASLEIAIALALGFDGPRTALATLCQHAEQLATGVSTGILDQLTIACATEHHAMLLDCGSLAVRHVPVPEDLEIVVVHTGVERTAASAIYAQRVDECERAEVIVGPLRSCEVRDLDRIPDTLLRRRARHVISENARVEAFRGALEHHDLGEAGRLMNESHRSLALDYEVSSAELDELVHYLQGLDGVYGARLTGAGLGGCAVAACRPGALVGALAGRQHWAVQASQGAVVR